MIAGSEASDGFAGSAVKSVFTLTLRVEIAYKASLSGNTPASSVSAAEGAIQREVAPSTASSSYTLPPLIESPSTSKTVMYIRMNAGIEMVVPAYTNRKSNSAARIVVGVPSAQDAVTESSCEPESQ